jgi:hypothetical protein
MCLVLHMALSGVKCFPEGYIEPEESIEVHVKDLTCLLNHPPVDNFLWSSLMASRDRRVFLIQAHMRNTNDLAIVSDNEIGHIRIFTPGFVDLAKQFEE